MGPKKGDSLEDYRSAIATACAAVGIKDREIQVSGRSVVVPSAGLTLTPELSDGVRIWRGTVQFSVMSVLDDNSREANAVVLEEPFEWKWQLAKKVALHLAERRIDGAIDGAAT